MKPVRMHHSKDRKLWPLLGEFLAALAMLAILILSFNPVTPVNSVLSSASASENFAPLSSWCGDGTAGEEDSHFGACHACRVNPVVLPEPPCDAEPAFGALIKLPSVAGDVFSLPAPAAPEIGPRAPPVSV